jgi:hypothetical protein
MGSAKTIDEGCAGGCIVLDGSGPDNGLPLPNLVKEGLADNTGVVN